MIKQHIDHWKQVAPTLYKDHYSHIFDNGWVKILIEAFTKLERINKEYPFQIVQLKEKFGGIRLYTSNATSEVLDICEELENQSETICEVCGASGYTRTDRSWYKTLCDYCVKCEKDDFCSHNQD